MPWFPGAGYKKARLAPGFQATIGGDDRGEGVCSGATPALHGERAAAPYQLTRGPMNHWASPSANFTSPLRPQVSLNFTLAPTRP